MLLYYTLALYGPASVIAATAVAIANNGQASMVVNSDKKPNKIVNPSLKVGSSVTDSKENYMKNHIMSVIQLPKFKENLKKLIKMEEDLIQKVMKKLDDDNKLENRKSKEELERQKFFCKTDKDCLIHGFDSKCRNNHCHGPCPKGSSKYCPLKTGPNVYYNGFLYEG